MTSERLRRGRETHLALLGIYAGALASPGAFVRAGTRGRRGGKGHLKVNRRTDELGREPHGSRAARAGSRHCFVLGAPLPSGKAHRPHLRIIS